MNQAQDGATQELVQEDSEDKRPAECKKGA